VHGSGQGNAFRIEVVSSASLLDVPTGIRFGLRSISVIAKSAVSKTKMQFALNM